MYNNMCTHKNAQSGTSRDKDTLTSTRVCPHMHTCAGVTQKQTKTFRNNGRVPEAYAAVYHPTGEDTQRKRRGARRETAPCQAVKTFAAFHLALDRHFLA